MTCKIKILSNALVNRIAAGEVVERPASVVKELIENAIDAGSSEIVIRLREGGKRLISVSDNGEGMAPEDALLAFERYATSKLSTEEELDSIRSLGFRGEALPSIAAVSRINLSTQGNESQGIELELVSGNLTFQRETARAQGTEITVSDLFENYPARKKFLRSSSTELAQVAAVVNQMALVHFGISFELVHHEKKLFRYPAVEKLGDRLFQIYGREISEKLIPIRQEMDPPEFEMEGFVTLPPHSYGTRSMQELFVNGRPIKNQVIQHALYEAYASHLMKGQHPAYFLLIQLDPARVDVNVHPSKKEVRFSDSALIHQLVYKSVKRSLTQEMISQPGEPVYREIEQETVRENANAFKVKEGLKEYVIRSVFNTAPDSANDRDLFRSDDLAQEPDFKVLGQFHEMFLLIQSGEELQIIDQHAAHERILFEKYRSGSMHDSRLRQSLLIPQTIEMTFKELLVLKEYERYFADVGIELDIFGENAVVVRALPVYLAKADIRALLAQFIEEIEIFQGFSSEKEKREGMIATLACHAAIKAGQSLQPPEIAALFKELCKLETALTCPHGRPIKHNFSLTELEKMFCRI